VRVKRPASTGRDAEARATHLATEESARLLGYFVRRVESAEDAADLVAEVFTVIWSRRDSLPHDPDSARMWAFGVARKVLSRQRRSRLRRYALAERLRANIAAWPASESDHGVAVDVRRAIDLLSNTDREVVRLVHWEGFSLSEAAAILGMRPGAARMRYARARERLSATLGAYRRAEP
jgi:RNA polymerase sigma-70 factor (ECF subfamily)